MGSSSSFTMMVSAHIVREDGTVHNSIRIQFVHTNFVTRYKIAVSPFSSPLVKPRHSLRDFVYHDGQNVPSRTSLLLLCSLEGRSLHALLLIFQVFSEMS